jgi:predicted SAM-dependent methyltransferase
MNKLPYLNLGCGTCFDRRWTNLDFVSTGEGVIAHNLLSGIPEPDGRFDVVYHSHVLEHFPRERALPFLRECHRVLTRGGIIRVAVPDLEQIARNYLQHLHDSLLGVPLAREKHEWSVLEMLDQAVRTRSGGEMARYVADSKKGNDAYLLERNGEELRRLIAVIRANPSSLPPAKPVSALRRLKAQMRRMLVRRLLGASEALLEEVRFRQSGEIHQWMYDRFSLAEVLREAGFNDAQVRTAFESDVPDWTEFGLDGDSASRKVRKPDSLFMEARK